MKEQKRRRQNPLNNLPVCMNLRRPLPWRLPACSDRTGVEGNLARFVAPSFLQLNHVYTLEDFLRSQIIF